MARLTNLGAGDYADRLTILALKCLHYGAAGKPVEHLRNEQACLLTKLYAGPTLPQAGVGALLELGAVNGALWQLTDDLRRIERDIGTTHREFPIDVTATPWVIAGKWGIEIMRLNDRRAELVDAINKATGEFLGHEKG